MPSPDDWRRQGQERYLKRVALGWRKYIPYRKGWDHDHCAFCGAKFMESADQDILTEGYATDDNYRWVCRQCFEDFRDEFEWKVTNKTG